MKPLNIIFAGTPSFSLPCLEALHAAGHNLVLILTQPDRPSGRGQKIQASPIKQWALNQHLPIAQPENLKTDAIQQQLRAVHADLMVVVAYGLILPESVLKIPRLGCINVHASLLPRWRGAAPVQYAIRHGDQQTGISIMQMDIGMDTGDILKQNRCAITPDDTAATLLEKLSHLAPPTLLATITELMQNQIHRQAQESHLACYAPKIQKNEAHINWHHGNQTILLNFRALYPWPGAYTYYQDQCIKIHAMHELTHDSIEKSTRPGTILAHHQNAILVKTGDGIIAIHEWQWPNENMTSLQHWLKHKAAIIPIGSLLT